MTAPSRSLTFTEQARRAQITDAAIATVNDVGYPRASLAQIAQTANVAKSAIGYYFASKDALMLHVVDVVFAGLYEALGRAVDTQSDPRSRLRAYAEEYLRYVDANRAPVAAGVEILVSHRGSDGVPLYLAGAEDETVLLRDILSAGIGDGVFRPMPVAVAVNITEAILFAAVTEIQRDLDADLSQVIPEILAVIDAGLEF